MEYLVAAVILYFILQTAANLVLIMRGGNPSIREEPPQHDWQGPSPHNHTGAERGSPRYWNDVEEATWEDVE